MELSSISKGQIVVYAAYFLIGVGVFVVTRYVMQESESRAAQENLSDYKDKQTSSGFVKLVRPIYTQYFVPMVRGKAFWDKYRKIYKLKVASAGMRDEFTADEFIAFKLFLIFFFPVVLGFLKANDLLDADPMIIFASPIVGWFYPDFWAGGRIKDRQKKILRALPFIVDLLALSTEAGLDFIGAIQKVVEKAKPSPLVNEFSQALKEIRVGASRQEALKDMSTRINMTEINSFVAVLVSADQMGASIGKVLRQQSDQIRVTRMLAAEKAGAAAAQKIMLPTIVAIVPAVFIMIGAPFILAIMYPPTNVVGSSGAVQVGTRQPANGTNAKGQPYSPNQSEEDGQ